MANSNEYMRQYMKDRRSKRRRAVIDFLGAECDLCGTTEDLEVDHIVPGSRSFVLSGCFLDKSWAEILTELDKCHLLCHSCHVSKTTACNESGGGHNKREDAYIHGTCRCYQELPCRCELCKQAKRLYRDGLAGYG